MTGGDQDLVLIGTILFVVLDVTGHDCCHLLSKAELFAQADLLSQAVWLSQVELLSKTSSMDRL